MRTVSLLSLSILILASIAASEASTPSQTRTLSMGKSGPETLPDLAWDDFDYSVLAEKLRVRGVVDSDAELEKLFNFNMRFVYSNKYRREQFLVDPGPQRFVQTILRILELNEQLDGLIVEGRRLTAGMEKREVRKKGRKLVRDISEIAREIKDVFSENFFELHGSTVQVAFVKKRGVEALQFYLVQANRINLLLTERLNEYFFGTAPGAVSVPDYQKATVNVLAQALIKLGELNAGRI